MDSTAEYLAPNKYAAHAIASMILNVESVTSEYVTEAHRAIVLDMGTWPNVTAAIEAYEDADRNGDTTDYARAIGSRICDRLSDSLHDFRTEAEAAGLSTTILDIVLAPLDLVNDAQQRLIGEYFLPSPADLVATDWEESDDDE